jgi:hypothetical protein
MNGDAIDFAIIAPAFLAGLLVLATHVPLGAQVLKRGIVFIDLAIAQIAASICVIFLRGRSCGFATSSSSCRRLLLSSLP